MAFTSDADGDITDGNPMRLRDFFRNDDVEKDFYALVVNRNGSTVLDVSGSSGSQFSSNMRPNANGYYSTSRLSADDGIWGFNIGSKVDGDFPGPHLSTVGSDSYGTQNRNSSDGSSSYFWGSESGSDSNHIFYFFRGITPE